MANEITVVGVRGRQVQLLMLFPIATPAQDAQSVAYVPTPSAGLPAKAAEVLTQPEKDALDDGTSYFKTIEFDAPEGATPAQILAAAQAKYATWLAQFPDKYAAETEFYDRLGARFDAS